VASECSSASGYVCVTGMLSTVCVENLALVLHLYIYNVDYYNKNNHHHHYIEKVVKIGVQFQFYRSYRNINTEVSLFGPLCIIYANYRAGLQCV